ncbi:MAG: calcium-binding protein [Myxococcota bacterium]
MEHDDLLLTPTQPASYPLRELIGAPYGLHGGSDLGTGTDRVEFGTGILQSGVTVSRVNDDLVMTISSGGSLTVKEWYDDLNNRMEEVVFASGVIWDTTTVESKVTP